MVDSGEANTNLCKVQVFVARRVIRICYWEIQLLLLTVLQSSAWNL